MESLKIAVSSDWHISDWNQFSEIDDTGRPSRLLQYIDLATDLVKFAEQNKADVVVLAGDIVDQFGILKPMVSDVLDIVINSISKKFPLVMTHGQHDINTKSEDIAMYHSALSRFKNNTKIIYASTPTMYTIKGYEFYIIPWNAEHELPPKTVVYDVFVGHGSVQGCTNWEGYKFNSGFPQEELFQRARLSIIGDIHNGQLFRKDDLSKILIPGSPIQFNYKDNPVTGFWLCEINKEKFVDCEFTSIEDIHPDFYHRFLFTSEKSTVSSRLVHYRFKPEKVSNEKISKTEFKRDTSSIMDIGLEIIKQSKIHNQKEVTEQFKSLMDSISSSDRKVPRSKIQYLNIKGFLSIEDLSLEMKEFPDNLVVVGKNGCLSGDTKVKLLSGESVPIKDLLDKEDFWVYSFDINSNRIVPGRASCARVTRKNAELVKLSIIDNKGILSSFVLTGCHPVLLTSGKYVEVRNLSVNDSIESVYESIPDKGFYSGYKMVIPKNDYDWRDQYGIPLHQLITYNKYGRWGSSETRERVHHINHNKMDNRPSNLEYVSNKDHLKHHALDIRWNIEEMHDKQSKFLSNQNKNPEFKRKAKEGQRRYLDNGGREIVSKRLGDLNRTHPCKRDDITFEMLVDFSKDKESITQGMLVEYFNCSRQRIYNIIENQKLNWDDFKSQFNHKVVSVETLDHKEDVYDLSVNNYNNFAIDDGYGNGIFVHNSGKTALVEALYWCLTGATTKGISANDVVNYYGDGHCEVVLGIEVEGTMYQVLRSRAKGTPQLTVMVFYGQWQAYKGNSTKSTQDMIYDLLGLSQEEIKLLSYFSAKSPSLYGTLTKSTRYDLISTIAGMSDVDKARDIINETYSKTSRERVASESAIAAFKSVETSSKTRIKDFLIKKDAQTPIDTLGFTQKKFEAEDKIKKFPEEEVIRKQIGECYKSYNEYQKETSRLTSMVSQLNFEFESVNSSIMSNRDKLKRALEGKCPTCGQDLHDEKVINDLSDLVLKLQNRLPDLEVNTSYKKEIGELRTKSQASDTLRASLEKHLEELYFWKGQLSLYEKKLSDVNKSIVDYDSLINEEMKNKEDLVNKISLENFKLEEISERESAQSWIKLTLLKRNGLLITELSKQGKKILQEQINELTYGEDIEVIVQDDLSVSAKFLKRKEGYYELLSTGQSRVVDIIMMVALNNVFMKFYGLEMGPLGLVVFDEVLSFLDPEYIDFCFSLIQKTNVPKRIVITHDNQLISRFDSRIDVKLVPGDNSSDYKKNWSSS